MNHVTQPFNSKKCGQSCLSMITGNSLEEICKDLGKDGTTNIDNDIMKYLNRQGYKTRLIKGYDITYSEIPDSSIIRLSYPTENGHFIVKHKGKYYDPAVGIIQEIKSHTKITHYLTFENQKKG